MTDPTLQSRFEATCKRAAAFEWVIQYEINLARNKRDFDTADRLQAALRKAWDKDPVGRIICQVEPNRALNPEDRSL